VIHTSYLALWDARRYCVFKERHLTIYVDTYMKRYLSITHRFITSTWSCFLRCHRNPMHYVPRYRDKINWYAILFYIQHLLNTRLFFLWMMTINLFLIYVYRFITWYRRLGKQQQLSVKVLMRWDVLWPALRLIYVVVKFKRLERLSILKWH
jgi:hypothetical protein